VWRAVLESFRRESNVSLNSFFFLFYEQITRAYEMCFESLIRYCGKRNAKEFSAFPLSILFFHSYLANGFLR